MKANESVHVIAGFHFYITWDDNGKEGKDQRGVIWTDRATPRCSIPAIPAICEATKCAIEAASKAISKTKNDIPNNLFTQPQNS